MGDIIGANSLTCKNRVEKYILNIEIGTEFKAADMIHSISKFCSMPQGSALLARDDRVEQISRGTWRRIK